MERIGRGEKVRTAVLTATLAELTEKGYTGLTIDDIARRTGVHKTTIYRRWQDLRTLVLDALTVHAATDIPIPDTGSIDQDLERLAGSFVEWVTCPPGRAIMAVLVSDAARFPEVRDIRKRLFEDGPRRAAPMIAAAIDRGELPPDVDPAGLISTLIAPIFFALVVTEKPVTLETAGQAARAALAAAKAGALKAR